MKATVYPITDATPNHIAIVARPRGNDWLCEEISALSREGIEILVSMLTAEEAEELGLNDESAECAATGITFVNVPIPDRSVTSDTADREVIPASDGSPKISALRTLYGGGL